MQTIKDHRRGPTRHGAVFIEAPFTVFTLKVVHCWSLKYDIYIYIYIYIYIILGGEIPVLAVALPYSGPITVHVFSGSLSTRVKTRLSSLICVRQWSL